MSELVPEVGDLWKYFGKNMIVVGASGYLHPICVIQDGDEFDIAFLFQDNRCNYTYLGKSKANINQLFEVDDENN